MKVVTVLGPSQSGKTTLVDALSRLDDSAPTSLTLSDGVGLTSFDYLGESWAAIDIPGGPDSIAAVGPALATSDAAVVCVPPEADNAVLAAPYIRLVEEAGIPSLIFVNHMDTCSERVRDIVAALQNYSRHSLVLRQVPIHSGSGVVGAVDLISERAWQYQEGKPSALIPLPDEIAEREKEARAALLESFADFDDALLEQLIEDHKPMTEDIFELSRRVLQHNDLISVFLGAASHDNGVTRLMKSLRHEAPGYENLRERLGADGDVIAVGSLADVRKHLGKVVLVRALGPGVAAGANLAGSSAGAFTAFDLKTPIKDLEAGRIGLALKSDHLIPARLYTAAEDRMLPDWARARGAMFRQVIWPMHEKDDARMSGALQRLAEIDPGLTLEQDEETGRAVIGTQGPLHARRLIERLQEEFGIESEVGPVSAAFRETIRKTVEWHHRHRKQSGGAGQFADVVIDLKPLPRGSGYQFDEIVKGGAVPRNYIPSVDAGAQDALVEGPKGFRVVDVGVTLKDGKAHSVDSSDYAFRTAGKNAVREALAEAGAFVLQPIVKVEIHVPSIYAGGLVPTVSGLKGQVLGFEAHPTAAGWDVFSTLMPAAKQDELFRALGSATRGTAWFVAEFDHYVEASPDDIPAAKDAPSHAHA